MQWADVKEFVIKIVLGRGSGFFLYPVRVADHFPQLKPVHLTILLILPFIYICKAYYIRCMLRWVAFLHYAKGQACACTRFPHQKSKQTLERQHRCLRVDWACWIPRARPETQLPHKNPPRLLCAGYAVLSFLCSGSFCRRWKCITSVG